MAQIPTQNEKAPIENLSPDKLYWLRKWVGKQAKGSSVLRDLSEEQIMQWLTCALTLADWLRPHRERLSSKPRPRIVLVGATAATEAANGGQPLRYVAPLLGIPQLDLHLVGRECPAGILQPASAEFPSQVIGLRNNWQEVEEKEIAEGMDAAFLFHPGLHCTPEDLRAHRDVARVPTEHGSDLLETGCFKAIIRAKLPLGMTAFNLKDAKKDCEKLEANGFKTANLQKNRWGIKGPPAIRKDTGEIARDEDGEIIYNANSLYVWDVIGYSNAA